MSVVTKRFDADKWRLVPRKATDTMKKAAQDCHECDNGHIKYGAQYIYSAMLAAAPQPEELSLWRDIETLPPEGLVLMWEEYTLDSQLSMLADPVNCGGYAMLGSAKFYWECKAGTAPKSAPYSEFNRVTHWMPLPQPPEVK
jgi:hypothetical protein